MEATFSITSLNEDRTYIPALPSNVVPTSKPSPAIKRLLQHRHITHELNVKQMKNDFHKENLIIDNEVYMESEVLKRRISTLKKEIEALLNTSIRQPEIEPVSLNNRYLDEIIEKIETLNGKRINLIDQYYDTLIGFEKKRSKQFKKILKENYHKLYKNAQMLPHQIDIYFEKEILKINEITMQNYHSYCNLRIQLKLQIEEDMRIWMMELIECRDKYKIAIKKMRVKSLVDIRVSKFEGFKGEMLNGKNILPNIRPLNLADDISFQTNVPLTSMDVEIWSKRTQETLNALDNNARKLVGFYKVAVVNVFNRFFYELQKVTDDMVNEENTEAPDVEYINAEVYKPIIEDITQQYTCEVTDLQNLWDSITSYMESNIKNTYLFLQGSSHLWDAHFDRVMKVQSMILKELKSTIDKNDNIAQDYEKKINTTIDKLRQESTIGKLNKYLDYTNKLLDSIENMFCSQCEAEIKVMEKYYILIEQEIDVLLSEIKRFLGENTPNGDGEKSQKPDHQVNSIEDYNLIPHQMKVCKYQVDAVNNWMFGLWEAIKLYMSTCRKELSEEATIWVEKQIDKLRKRLEVKMAVHKPRYQRIKILIYDTRLEELQTHLQQVEHLEETISQAIETARIYNKTSKDEQETELKKYMEETSQIAKKLANVKKSQEIYVLQNKINCLTDKTTGKLEQIHVENINYLQGVLNNVKKSNCDFIEAMKLFSEDGNFSCEEVKMFNKRITALNNMIPKKISTMIRDVNANKLGILQILQGHVDEITHKLIASRNEFHHNEQIVVKIKELQHKVYSQVYDIRFKMKRVESYIDHFIAIAENSLGKSEDLHIITNAFNECSEKIGELCRFIQYYEDIFDQRPSRLSELEYNLFRNRPQQDNTYMNILNTYIYESLMDIQDVAKNFYQSHGDITNKDRIQPNFKSFMEEILRIYYNYKLQCEISWLQNIQELSANILRLLKFIQEYHGASITKYLSDSSVRFKKITTSFIEKIKSEMYILEDRYFEINSLLMDDNLNDSNIFEALKNKFDSIRVNNEMDIENSAAEIKEKLESEYGEIVKSITALHVGIENLDSNNVTNGFLKELLNQFHQKLHAIDFMRRSMDEIEDVCENVPTENRKSCDFGTLSVSELELAKVIAYKEHMDAISSSDKKMCKSNLTLFIKNTLGEINGEYEKMLYTIEDTKMALTTIHKNLDMLYTECIPETMRK